MDGTQKIKAVLFDLGNTLVYSHPEETFKEILETQDIVKSVDDVKKALTQGNREFDVEEHIHLPIREFYTQWNIVQLEHLGITDKENARKLAEIIDSQWFNYAQIYVYPDTKETLKKLKQKGLKLGIITGGFEEDVERILPAVNLEAIFDIYVGTNTVGKRKPHPEVFQHALKLLRIQPEEAIFIGDQLEADYQGAQRVGMKALLIVREGKPMTNVDYITSLREVFDFL